MYTCIRWSKFSAFFLLLEKILLFFYQKPTNFVTPRLFVLIGNNNVFPFLFVTRFKARRYSICDIRCFVCLSLSFENQYTCFWRYLSFSEHFSVFYIWKTGNSLLSTIQNDYVMLFFSAQLFRICSKSSNRDEVRNWWKESSLYLINFISLFDFGWRKVIIEGYAGSGWLNF